MEMIRKNRIVYQYYRRCIIYNVYLWIALLFKSELKNKTT
jgi:hypothetical protein